MSASRDKGSRIAFVYSNLYRIYRESQNETKEGAEKTKVALPSNPTPSPVQQNILKVGDLKNGEFAKHEVRSYQPTEFISKKIDLARQKEILLSVNPPLGQEGAKLTTTPAASTRGGAALDDLKGNLKQLNDLQSRLKFMLGELEDILKK